MRRFLLISLILPALPLVALAQVSTTTTSTVTVGDLLSGGMDAYAAFKGLGVLAGLSAVINLLINLTKYGPLAVFIKRRGWRWLRPLLAFVAGAVGGVVAGLAEGRGGIDLGLYVVGGLMSGGGAIALHELISVIKGDRK